LFGQLLDSVKNEVTKVADDRAVSSLASSSTQAAQSRWKSRADNISNVTYSAPTETGEVETTLDAAGIARRTGVADRRCGRTGSARRS
jgi:preprotein translocase subunit SecA